MRGLIAKFPELAEIVLDKCYKETKTDGETCIEMNFEFIEDTFNYQKVEKKETSSSLLRFRSEFSYQHVAESAKSVNKEDGFDEPYSKDFQLRMRVHPLMVMVNNSRAQLLRHPLCLALIRQKWYRVGRTTYSFILLCYMAFLASITTFILTSPNPVNYPEYYNCSQYFSNQNDRPLFNATIDFENPYVKANFGSKICVWIMFCIYCLRFIIEETPFVIIKVIILPQDLKSIICNLLGNYSSI